MITCLLAEIPTSLVPSSKKATTDGVVLIPSAFSITLTPEPSIMATQELVVPKSIPMILKDYEYLLRWEIFLGIFNQISSGVLVTNFFHHI